MHQPERVDAPAYIFEAGLSSRILQPRELEPEQAVDELQVVLHAMIHLAQKEAPLGDQALKVGVRGFELGRPLGDAAL